MGLNDIQNNIKIVDLSATFCVGMPKYKSEWFPEFSYKEIAPQALVNNDWKRRFTVVSMFAHNGTHVETSDHVFKDGHTLEKTNLNDFIGHPVIIDLTDIKDGESIKAEDILSKIENRKIPEKSIILLKTGYNDRAWEKDYFWDKSPWLDAEAVKVVADLKPRLVGIDFQTEKPNEKNFIVHKTLASAGCIICEYLFNLDKIDENYIFMGLPIKMPELEAAPIRAAGILIK